MIRHGAALGRFFRFEERGATLRGEMLGGLTTFMTMAYIIFVNAAILSAAGMPPGAVMVATCLAAAFASTLMGLLANLPVALAPGMGMNAFVAFTLCGPLGFSWQQALGMVFWSGVIFLALSLVRFRERIMDAIPRGLKYGAAAGIGLFIAFIGLQHAGFVTYQSETLVQFGSLAQKHALVALFGLVATVVLFALRVRGAVLFGMLATGAVSVATGLVGWEAGHDLGFGDTFCKLDFFGAFRFSPVHAVPAVLTLLFFDTFDTVGTLVGVAEEANLVDDEGRIPNAGRALASDAAGTVAGSLFGTSTVTSYIESAAGVAAGARTGLSSIVVAALFLASLVALPVVGVFGQGMEIETMRLVGRPPALYAHPVTLYPITAPALIVVGFLMTGALRKIRWERIGEGLPAFLTMIVMPLTFSISSGLAAGFVSYSLLDLVGRLPGRVHSTEDRTARRGHRPEEGEPAPPRAHVLVHVIACLIVVGYATLKIVSHLESKGAGPQ
jgi:AGZA family xanthine/uracil permease-like MFS transporter